MVDPRSKKRSRQISAIALSRMSYEWDGSDPDLAIECQHDLYESFIHGGVAGFNPTAYVTDAIIPSVKPQQP